MEAVQRKLENRLALRIGLFLGAFVLVLGGLVFSYGYRLQLKDAMARQDQLAHTVLSSASVAAFARNPDIANDVLNGLIGNTNVLAARIESQDGFAETAAKQADFSWTGVNATAYPLHSPISDSESIGSLSIAPDEEHIRSEALIYGMGYAALPILEILAAAVLLIFLLRKFVGRPVATIAIGLSTIEPGQDLGVRVPVPPDHAEDEIGLLARSANRLIEATEVALERERNLRLQVQAMEERYRHIFQTTNIGIMVLNARGQLINSNPALLDNLLKGTMTLEQAQQMPDLLPALFKTPDVAWDLIRQSAENGHSITADLALVDLLDDKPHWVNAIFSASLNSARETETIEAVLFDVTARKQHEEDIRQAAERDPLTGLHNRRGYELLLDKMLRRCSEDNASLCVMLIDLDGFKAVNDRLGHAAGDEVLKCVAKRLQAQARRNTDMIGRLGGDEFVVVRYDCGNERQVIGDIATQLVQLLSAPIEVSNGETAKIGASIGLALAPHDGVTRKALLDAADAAMYAVKRKGKNGFAWAKDLHTPG